MRANLGKVSDLTNCEESLSSNRPLTNSGRGCFVRNQEPPSWGAEMLCIITGTEFAISSLLSVSKSLLPSSVLDRLPQIGIFFWSQVKFRVTG